MGWDAGTGASNARGCVLIPKASPAHLLASLPNGRNAPSLARLTALWDREGSGGLGVRAACMRPSPALRPNGIGMASPLRPLGGRATVNYTYYSLFKTTKKDVVKKVTLPVMNI